MDILLLSTSAQHSAENSDVILDPKLLIKWINNLPVMNLPRTVSELHTSIKSLNELQISDKQRLSLVDIYYESLQDILVSYDEMRISMLQIDVKQRNALREDIMWLYLSLANGYKLIIKNAFDSGKSLKKDTYLLTIYTAMELLIEGLVYGYSSHQTPPPLARLEINQLFSLAVHLGLSEKEVKGVKGHARLPTVSRLFKQYVLLSISNPYRLISSEVLELFLFLESIVDDCVIDFNGSPEPPEGKFLIDLNSDTSPIACAYRDQSIDPKDMLIVDVWPIIHVLGTMMAKYQKDQETIMVIQEQHMIEILIEQLGRKNVRQAKREKVHLKTQVAMGIDAVHNYVSAKYNKKRKSVADNQDFQFPLSEWTIKNRSENGFMLETNKNNTTSELTIGDIISFPVKTEQQETDIKYSIIRWIQNLPDNSIQIGVELLPNQVLPIMYKAESKYGVEVDDGLGLLGLYFPATNDKEETESILIEKEVYKQNQNITLINKNREYKIIITALLLNSPLYVQLKFKKKI